VLSGLQLSSQNIEHTTDSCRIKKISTISVVTTAYAGGMTGLYFLWYKDFPQSEFHFFNDNDEWLQMDKVGHAYSAYHLAEFGYNAAKYSCFTEKQSVWLGGGFGMLFLTTVEVFDGFSAGWGASFGDVLANTSGYLLFAGQQQIWQQQHVRMKFSYAPSPYAKYRPDLLGNGAMTSILKDYNAQKYWLSFSPASFTKSDSFFWPQWLCFSFGYSGDGMLGGSENPTQHNGNILPYYYRNRQFLLSLDVDFSKIQTNSAVLKKVFYALNLVKMPFPMMTFDKTNGLGGNIIGF
jgi:uncharacterized protein YfiM (DUF2279 family)